MAEAITEEDIILEWTTAVEALDIYSIKELIELRPNLLWTPLKNSNHLESDFSHFIRHLEEFQLLGTSIRPVYALHHILFDYGLPDDEWTNERIELVDFILKNTKGNELNTCLWGEKENTIMHLAFLINKPELTQQLLDSGALINIPNSLGHLPIKDSKQTEKSEDKSEDSLNEDSTKTNDDTSADSSKPVLLINKKLNETTKEKVPLNASDKFKRLRELAESPGNAKRPTERQNSTRRYFRPGHLEERKRRVLSEEEEAELEKQKLLRQKDIQLLAQRSAVKNNPLFKKFEEQQQQQQQHQQENKVTIRSAASIMRDRRKLLRSDDQIKRSSRVINSLKENSYVTSSIFRQQAASTAGNESSLKIPKPKSRAPSPISANDTPDTSDNEDDKTTKDITTKKSEESYQEESYQKEIYQEKKFTVEKSKEEKLHEEWPKKEEISKPAIIVESLDNENLSEKIIEHTDYNENIIESSPKVSPIHSPKRSPSPLLVDQNEIESLAIGKLKNQNIFENKSYNKKGIDISTSKVKEIINAHEHLNNEEELEIYSTGKVFSVWKKDASSEITEEEHNQKLFKQGALSEEKNGIAKDNSQISESGDIENKPVVPPRSRSRPASKRIPNKKAYDNNEDNDDILMDVNKKSLNKLNSINEQNPIDAKEPLQINKLQLNNDGSYFDDERDHSHVNNIKSQSSDAENHTTQQVSNNEKVNKLEFNQTEYSDNRTKQDTNKLQINESKFVENNKFKKDDDFSDDEMNFLSKRDQIAADQSAQKAKNKLDDFVFDDDIRFDDDEKISFQATPTNREMEQDILINNFSSESLIDKDYQSESINGNFNDHQYTQNNYGLSTSSNYRSDEFNYNQKQDTTHNSDHYNHLHNNSHTNLEKSNHYEPYNTSIPLTIQTVVEEEYETDEDEATTPTLANPNTLNNENQQPKNVDWQTAYDQLLNQQDGLDFDDDENENSLTRDERLSTSSSFDEMSILHTLNYQQKAKEEEIKDNLENYDDNRESFVSVQTRSEASGSESWYDPDETTSWNMDSKRQSFAQQQDYYHRQQRQSNSSSSSMGSSKYSFKNSNSTEITRIEDDYRESEEDDYEYYKKQKQQDEYYQNHYKSMTQEEDISYSHQINDIDRYQSQQIKTTNMTTMDNNDVYGVYHEDKGVDTVQNKSTSKVHVHDDDDDDYYSTALHNNKKKINQENDDDEYYSTALHNNQRELKQENEHNYSNRNNYLSDMKNESNDYSNYQGAMKDENDDYHYSTRNDYQRDKKQENDDYFSYNHHQRNIQNEQNNYEHYQQNRMQEESEEEGEGEIVVFMDSSNHDVKSREIKDKRIPQHNDNGYLSPYSAQQSNQQYLNAKNSFDEEDAHSLIRIPSQTNTIYVAGQDQELEYIPHDPKHPRIEDISHYLKSLDNENKQETAGVSSFDNTNEQDHVMVKRVKSTKEIQVGQNNEITQTLDPNEPFKAIPNAHEINQAFNSSSFNLRMNEFGEENKVSLSSFDATGYGKMYIGVSGAHHVLLPLPKEITYVRCVISDGEYEYMSKYEILTEQILMDYECIIDTKPGMIITVSLHVRPDYHVRPKTGWTRWFTSIRKQKEHLSGYVYPEDGAIGQTRFAVDHMIPGCYKKTYQAYFDCFNSWYARTYQERARREKFGDEEDFLKIVGKLNIEMLYLPVSSPSVQVPKSLRECDLTLKICQWHETCWQSGYLSTRRQGTKVWERHYYRLIGSQLIGYTSEENGNTRQVYNHFNIADVIRLSAASDKVIVNLVEDEDTNKIFTESINTENNEKGFFRLSFRDYYLDCVCDNMDESEEWVKTLKSMIGHVQRFHYILDGIKNVF